MEFVVHNRIIFPLLDTIVGLWREKAYPYNRPDAIIPQTIIPQDLRSDRFTLACFYFYACIYMRGGIESLQAFNALIRMWRTYPDLFDPGKAAFMSHDIVQPILKKHIGWDSKEAARNWIENSQRLLKHWGGDPLRLLQKLRGWDESCRRMRNKLSKKDRIAAGDTGGGFRGWQFKMVSMYLYFCDWEGWLERPFIYPSPADFHNFRFGLANEGIEVRLSFEEDTIRQIEEETEGGLVVRNSEKLSKPWRDCIMAYLRARNTTPVELADALWLFSLVMCGNSPLTLFTTKRPNGGAPLLTHGGVAETWEQSGWALQRRQKQLQQTCLVCPVAPTCKFAIPSQPYYRKGKLIMRPRRQLDVVLESRLVKPPRPAEVELDPEVRTLLHL